MYEGFKKLTAGGMSPALAAWIGRHKYGAKVFDAHAAAGKSLRRVPRARRKVRRRK